MQDAVNDNGAPNPGKVDVEIIMDQDIARACKKPPGDFLVGCSKLRPQILGCFPNHFKIADHTILDQANGPKCFLTSFCVLGEAL
jgi:hypothetical protein